MAAVAEKVKQIIVEQLGVDENQVDNSASFVDDLGADSLDIVELVMAFEEAFELETPATLRAGLPYCERRVFFWGRGSERRCLPRRTPRPMCPSSIVHDAG